jgi:hypothetical protein
MSRLPSFPPLAGIATYATAARVGYSVDENVGRLTRIHWAERRLMSAMLAHLARTPEWEVKCALALHQWYAAEHADWLRKRISEMRHPTPPLDKSPNDALDAFLEEVLRSRGTVELLVALYQVALPALRDAYSHHLQATNPLVDQPTRRFMRFSLIEVTEAIDWGDAAISKLILADPTAVAVMSEWRDHLDCYLVAARGIAGDPRISLAEGDERRGMKIRSMEVPLPPPRATEPFNPDFMPRRDARFQGSYNFEFPPHVIYNDLGVPADERNLALLCKRTLEMDVPEAMSSFMVERADQPWDFYLDYSRQLWDEARHAMMGTVALEQRGIDWTELPLNVGFSLRLNLHATPQERQILLYAIEQSLMPSDTGKRFEYETAVAAGDELSAHFHDYDWADEVLHAQIGRRALKRDRITREEAIERGQAIHERTWAELDRYKSRAAQTNWWPDFVRRVLGKESAVAGKQLTAPSIVG